RSSSPQPRAMSRFLVVRRSRLASTSIALVDRGRKCDAGLLLRSMSLVMRPDVRVISSWQAMRDVVRRGVVRRMAKENGYWIHTEHGYVYVYRPATEEAQAFRHRWRRHALRIFLVLAV